MAEESGSGFSGFLAGIVLVAIIIIGGVLLYSNGGLGNTKTAQINVHMPSSVNVPNPVNNGGHG